MANNCVISKLLSSFEDDSLKVYDTVSAQVYNRNQSGGVLELRPYDNSLDCFIEIVTDGKEFVGGGTKKSKTGGDWFAFGISSETPVKLAIGEKYALQKFNDNGAVNMYYNIEDFKYCKKLTYFGAAGCTHFEANNKVLEILAELPLIQTIDVHNSSVITETLESFVEKRFAKYPTCNDITLNITDTPATLNDNEVDATVYLRFNGSSAIIASNNTFTTVLATYNGTTWTYA